MAQVYLPDDPRVRAQLEGAETPAVKEQPRRRPRKPRRLGGIDLVVFLAVIAGATLIVLAAARGTTTLTPAAMAALLRPGTTVLDDWFDLEQYDELGRRMVLPDGIRATHNRESFFPTAGAWLLLAGCCQRGQYRGHIAWTCRARRAHRPA